MSKKRAKITARHPCDENHEVVTVTGGGFAYRREPCDECPWRKDRPVGTFPAEAYRRSANTAEDAATHMFSCHMAGSGRPQTCAGFLLKNSANHLGVRIAILSGRVDMAKVSSKVELYDSYRDMAVANGVTPDDPALARCRGDDEWRK